MKKHVIQDDKEQTLCAKRVKKCLNPVDIDPGLVSDSLK